MGRVLEPEEAEKSSCRCYKTDGDLICFSEGIVGALSQPQIDDYCTRTITKVSPELQEVYGRFKDMGVIQDVCLESEVSEQDYPSCVIDGGKLLKQDASHKVIEEKLADKYGVEVD